MCRVQTVLFLLKLTAIAMSTIWTTLTSPHYCHFLIWAICLRHIRLINKREISYCLPTIPIISLVGGCYVCCVACSYMLGGLLLTCDMICGMIGDEGEGIGGPHVGYMYAWPMAIVTRAMTSSSDEEVRTL